MLGRWILILLVLLACSGLPAQARFQVEDDDVTEEAFETSGDEVRLASSLSRDPVLPRHERAVGVAPTGERPRLRVSTRPDTPSGELSRKNGIGSSLRC
jgi:hypothetical protein